MQSNPYCLGYLTTATVEEARSLARVLVEKKLVACANLLPGMESIYHWEGKIETAKECVVLVKTTHAQKEKIVTLVKAMHSYDTPCTVFLPIEGGNPDFLKWITESIA